MAEKLSAYFAEADRCGGIKAVMRLTVLSSIPSISAARLPDSPENIEKLEKGIAEIRKEFNRL